MALVTFAGGNAPAIRYVSCETCELDPFWGAAMRFLVAGGLFAVIVPVLRMELPRGRAFFGAVLFGILQFGAGFGLIYWGLVRAPAGLGQVLLASVPLLTFALALAHRQERFRWEGIVGALLALGGIAAVFGSGLGAGVPLASMLAILIGALCWAEALIVAKRFPPIPAAAMNAVAMTVGALLLLVVSAAVGEAFALPHSASTWGAQAYLVFAGSLGVFSLYLFVLGRWTASAASYQLVLIPLVTVAVSAWLQDERITPAFAAGSLLVLAGIYVGALRRPKRQAAVAAPQQSRPAHDPAHRRWGDRASGNASGEECHAERDEPRGRRPHLLRGRGRRRAARPLLHRPSRIRSMLRSRPVSPGRWAASSV